MLLFACMDSNFNGMMLFKSWLCYSRFWSIVLLRNNKESLCFSLLIPPAGAETCHIHQIFLSSASSSSLSTRPCRCCCAPSTRPSRGLHHTCLKRSYWSMTTATAVRIRKLPHSLERWTACPLFLNLKLCLKHRAHTHLYVHPSTGSNQFEVGSKGLSHLDISFGSNIFSWMQPPLGHRFSGEIYSIIYYM